MYQTAREKGCLKYLNMLAEFLDVMGAEYQWFDKDEVAKRLGTYFYFKALYTDYCALKDLLIRNFCI